jgi:hypothetical protein
VKYTLITDPETGSQKIYRGQSLRMAVIAARILAITGKDFDIKEETE